MLIEIAQLLVSVAVLITAIGGLFRIRRVEHQTNSIKDELVAEAKKASYAAGQKNQREREDD